MNVLNISNSKLLNAAVDSASIKVFKVKSNKVESFKVEKVQSKNNATANICILISTFFKNLVF